MDWKKKTFALLALLIMLAGEKTGAQNVTDSLTMKPDSTYMDYLNGQELGEVVVTARKPTFSQKLDRKVYSVGQDIMATTGSVSDILQNVPTLDVDIDGNVSLRGNSNVTILIDGRPSAQMNSKNRGDILQQMPASQIDRIEVITNPSAEFKPDGTTGVVNIITKKNARSGLNGTASANIGSKGRYGAGANASWNLGKWSLNGGIAYKKDRYDRTTDDNRSYSDHNVKQQTYGLGHPSAWQFNLGTGVSLSPNDRLEASGAYSRRHFLRSEDIKSTDTSTSGNQLSTYQRTREADAKENGWTGSLHYQHNYGKENHLDVDYSYQSNTENEGNDYQTSTQTSGTTIDQREWQHVWDATYLHTASVRLEHHFSPMLTLKAGYELENERREQSYGLKLLQGTDWIADNSRSSDFANRRTIHSLYSTLQFSLGKWELLGGLRGEYVSQRSHLYATDSVASQHDFNLYPTFHASLHLSPYHSLMASYSLRVRRPDGDWLNPYAEYINPLSLRAGNPDLEPEKTHSMELGWQWLSESGTHLMATLYDHYTTNEIVWTAHNQANGQLLTRPENARSHNAAGLELVWSQPVMSWLHLDCNVNGFYSQITGTTQGSGSNHNAWSWTAMMNADITPLPYLTLQLNTRYRSRLTLAQGYRRPDFRLNLGARYDIPKWKLSLITSVTDLFNTHRKEQVLNTGDMVQHVITRRNPRIVYFGVVWNFGLQKKKHNEIKYDEGM